MRVDTIIDFDSSNNLMATAQNTKEEFMPFFELTLKEFLFPKDGEIANPNYKSNQFNMCTIDDWDKLILLVNGNDVHSIQFKVIDVDRKDAWDKVKNFLEGMISAVIGKIKGGISENLTFPFTESLGGAADDLQSFLLKKLAGGDKGLFRGSDKLEIPENGKTTPFKVEGQGTEEKYKIVGCLKKTEKD